MRYWEELDGHYRRLGLEDEPGNGTRTAKPAVGDP